MTREGNDKRFKDKKQTSILDPRKKTPQPKTKPSALNPQAPPTESVFGFLNILHKNNKKQKVDKAKEKKRKEKSNDP